MGAGGSFYYTDGFAHTDPQTTYTDLQITYRGGFTHTDLQATHTDGFSHTDPQATYHQDFYGDFLM